MSRVLGFSLSAALLSASAMAAATQPGNGLEVEACRIAVLRNDFTIQVARSETVGSDTQLWLCSGDGFVTIPTDQIERFEQREIAVPQAPALPPANTPETLPKPQGKDSIQTLITGAASRYQIDPDFVTSVVKAESGFNSAAVSPKGAQGLMQLMPRTAATLGVGNPFDPASNVEAGTRYLRQLLDQYSGDAVKALAAYNAGSRRVEQYGGIPPYRETRSYVSRIIDDYNRKKLQQQAQSTAAPAGK